MREREKQTFYKYKYIINRCNNNKRYFIGKCCAILGVHRRREKEKEKEKEKEREGKRGGRENPRKQD